MAECSRRISINEGVRLTMYYDSMNIPTIGVGYNLQRGEGPLKAVGADYAAILRGEPITMEQALQLLQNDLRATVGNARASLDRGIFDSLTDARRFVIVDLVYNMGFGTWIGFSGTRELIDMAQAAKNANNPAAHQYFVEAGKHLGASNYATQVGNRAKRNIAMLVTGIWCDANGDGSDVFSS